MRRKNSTPYDDVFRTLMNDCEKLLLPVLNEIFGKKYTGDEKIIFHQNEHFLNQQDGKSKKRITDSSFTVIDSEGNETNFIIEMQSTPDSTMIIRIFEYAIQVALDSAFLDKDKDRLIVTIPQASIIFLRSDKSTPDKMIIEIKTPDGNIDFKVPVMKIKTYSLPEIFKKELYFLLPFYIFNMESDFPVYDKDSKNLKREYNKFIDGIDTAVDKKKISAYYRRVLLDMSKKVFENITMKFKNLRKDVDEIMGGRVLEHEGKTIYNEGIAHGVVIGEARGITIGEARGEAIGEARGRSETMNAAINFMRSSGLSNDQIDAFRNSFLKPSN